MKDGIYWCIFNKLEKKHPNWSKVKIGIIAYRTRYKKMVAIKGIKMPQNCSECSFKANDYVCGLLDCAFSCNHFTERNYNCPLVEIVTCKDCKYNDENICTIDGCEITDDYFCVYAIRKESNL